ncbi:metallophosphoesterase family protein [Natrarchaeobius chitinivorans]|uniref:Calcineurin-like phosphoesterase domain-containing protein n=1 Tax=Natrarchaeobius chitinivorans TaxID=1679083 RepID=A0A3N6P2I7_NATCH|nr:metallophosphoesterase [Natrarchaeobius chitinivorans]RQG91809.1 hypothetical protein EA473_18605 [Natrarchaeobius chitinivorans]
MTGTDRPSRIAVVTDIHAKPDSIGELAEALSVLRTEIEREVQPDLIVALGDLVHGGQSEETTLELLEAVIDTLEGGETPVRYVPGNHDVAVLDRSTLEDAFGHELWSIEERIVFLDSTGAGCTGFGGEIGSEQRDALESQADALSNPIVFVHHPLGFRRLDENRWFHDRPEQAFCTDRVAINEILKAIEPAFVVNGHLHWSDHTRDGGTDHFTVDSFNKELSEKPHGAFGVVDLEDGSRVRLVESTGFERIYRLPQ